MISITKKKVLAISLLGVMLGILSLPKNEAQKNTSYKDNESQPAIFAENVAFVFYNENGDSSKLQGQKALFYPKAAKLEVLHPTATYTNLEDEQFEFHSAKGIYHETSNILTLTGNVLIEQKHPNNKTWSIRGSEFTIDKNQGFISSSQEVTINKDHNTMKSKGMKGSLNHKRIELLNDVRGQYEYIQ